MMTGDGPTWLRRRRRHTRGALGALLVLLAASMIAVGSGASVSAATFNCSNPVSTEGDGGGNSLTFVMSVSGILDGPISGTYMTRGAGEGYPPGEPPATATPDVDYQSTAGSFNLAFSGDEGDVFGNVLAVLCGLANKSHGRRILNTRNQRMAPRISTGVASRDPKSAARAP